MNTKRNDVELEEEVDGDNSLLSVKKSADLNNCTEDLRNHQIESAPQTTGNTYERVGGGVSADDNLDSSTSIRTKRPLYISCAPEALVRDRDPIFDSYKVYDGLYSQTPNRRRKLLSNTIGKTSQMKRRKSPLRPVRKLPDFRFRSSPRNMSLNEIERCVNNMSEGNGLEPPSKRTTRSCTRKRRSIDTEIQPSADMNTSAVDLPREASSAPTTNARDPLTGSESADNSLYLPTSNRRGRSRNISFAPETSISSHNLSIDNGRVNDSLHVQIRNKRERSCKETGDSNAKPSETKGRKRPSTASRKLPISHSSAQELSTENIERSGINVPTQSRCQPKKPIPKMTMTTRSSTRQLQSANHERKRQSTGVNTCAENLCPPHKSSSVPTTPINVRDPVTGSERLNDSLHVPIRNKKEQRKNSGDSNANEPLETKRRKLPSAATRKLPRSRSSVPKSPNDTQNRYEKDMGRHSSVDHSSCGQTMTTMEKIMVNMSELMDKSLKDNARVVEMFEELKNREDNHSQKMEQMLERTQNILETAMNSVTVVTKQQELTSGLIMQHLQMQNVRNLGLRPSQINMVPSYQHPHNMPNVVASMDPPGMATNPGLARHGAHYPGIYNSFNLASQMQFTPSSNAPALVYSQPFLNNSNPSGPLMNNMTAGVTNWMGRPSIMCNLSGTWMNALLDSGSGVNIISKETADAISTLNNAATQRPYKGAELRSFTSHQLKVNVSAPTMNTENGQLPQSASTPFLTFPVISPAINERGEQVIFSRPAEQYESIHRTYDEAAIFRGRGILTKDGPHSVFRGDEDSPKDQIAIIPHAQNDVARLGNDHVGISSEVIVPNSENDGHHTGAPLPSTVTE